MYLYLYLLAKLINELSRILVTTTSSSQGGLLFGMMALEQLDKLLPARFAKRVGGGEVGNIF